MSEKSRRVAPRVEQSSVKALVSTAPVANLVLLKASLFSMWISPNHQDTDFVEPWTLDDKITIFLDRTDGWQLAIAEQAGAIPHSGFAVLHVILSYFETTSKYHAGFAQHGQSKNHFNQGVELVFPTIAEIPPDVREAILSDLYGGARCGLYHAGMTAAHIALGPIEGGDIHYNPVTRRIVIDPHRLTKTLRGHLAAYGQRLRDPANADLRNRFEQRFEYDRSQVQGAEWQNP
jgi:hypothetical protein